MIGTIDNISIEESETINYAIKNVGLFKTSKNKQWCYFTYLWLKSKFCNEFINGSTQEYISINNLRGIEFLVPSKNFVYDFDNIVKNYFKKIAFNQNQIYTLQNIRDTLLPKLIGEKIKVKFNE